MRALLGNETRILSTARVASPPPFEPAPVNPPPTGLDGGWASIRRPLRLVLRRRRLILVMAAIGALLAVAVGVILRPTYSASAQIIIDQRGTDVANGGAAASQPGEEAAIETHVAVLTSDAHLRRVAATLLAQKAANDKPESASWSQAARDSVKWLLTQISAPFRGPAAELSPDTAANARALELKKNLRVGQERRSRVVTVVYASADPAQAAVIANTVVQVYLDDLTLRQRVEAQRLSAWLNKRIPEARLEVAQAEQNLEAYRLAHAATGTAQSDETAQQIAQLFRRLAMARSNADAVQERIERVKELRERPASALEVARILGSAPLAELVRNESETASNGIQPASDTPRTMSPAVRAEIDRSVLRLEAEVQSHQAQARQIEDRLRPLRAAANANAEGLSGLRALERQSAALGQLYDGLLRRQQEAFEQVQFVRPDARLLAAAWPPERPSSLHPAFLMPPAVIAFSIMGVLLAFGLGRLERTIRDEDDAVEALGVPCLGLVPRLSGWRAKRVHTLLRDEPQGSYARAVRSLLVSLLPNGARRSPHVIMLTSTVAGEGKTTLAWSLAILAARLRLKVLLVGHGERASALELELKGTRARLPTGDGAPGERAAVVERMRELEIDYVPAARLSAGLLPHAADPLANRWADQFRGAYDLIVVDAAAFQDQPEVGLLAGTADRVVFVLRCGETDRAAAQNALRLVAGAAGAETSSGPRIASVLAWAEPENGGSTVGAVSART
jgi:uncharacterized protein involved in exopolysaccharide biosynthesis